MNRPILRNNKELLSPSTATENRRQALARASAVSLARKQKTAANKSAATQLKPSLPGSSSTVVEPTALAVQDARTTLASLIEPATASRYGVFQHTSAGADTATTSSSTFGAFSLLSSVSTRLQQAFRSAASSERSPFQELGGSHLDYESEALQFSTPPEEPTSHTDSEPRESSVYLPYDTRTSSADLNELEDPPFSTHTNTTPHRPLKQLLPPGYVPQHAPLLNSPTRSSSISALSTASSGSIHRLKPYLRNMATSLIPGKLTFCNEDVTSSDMKEWLSRYDAVCSQLLWNDDQKLANVALYLDGALKHWARNTRFLNWADFETKLKAKVKAVQTPDLLEVKLYQRKILPHESFEDYYYNIVDFMANQPASTKKKKLLNSSFVA